MGTLKYKAKRRTSSRPEIYMTRVQRAYQQFPLAEVAVPLSGPIYVEELGNKSKGVEVHTRWANTVRVLK